jgi:uroporphyrinogen III methyltransferase/synthase
MSPPLAGLRVLITRPADQQTSWADEVRAHGAAPVPYPTIEVQPPPSWEGLDDALAHLEQYQWVLFTSAAAVRFTLSRATSPRLLSASGRKVAAVGHETARALRLAGVEVALVPEAERQEGLAVALAPVSAGTRVLFPQAVGGRVELRDQLTRQGCTVDVVPASQTVPVRPMPPLPPFDVATFASPSALRAFVAEHGVAPLAEKPLVAIGPTTAQTAMALGLSPWVAPSPSVQSVVETMLQHLPPAQRR